MQITIDIPDEIAGQLNESPDRVRRYLLELLVVEAYRTERITHFQVGKILDLPSRWAVDAFLKQHDAYLHYDEEDRMRDRETLRQLNNKNAAL